MAIGDLLNKIKGDQPTGNSPSVSTRPNLPSANTAPAKRKLDDGPRPSTTGLVRRNPPSPALNSRPSASGQKPAQAQRPVAGNGTKPTSSSSAQSAPPPASAGPSKSADSARSRGSTVSPAMASRPPPKKGSFAEILARGQRAQAVMGQVGKIQHKKVDRATPKGRREDATASTTLKRKAAPGYKGTSRPLPQGTANGSNGTSSKASASKTSPAMRSSSSLGKRGTDAEPAPKKIKKAAQMPTSYTGTARPKPTTTANKARPGPRGGALLNAPSSHISRRSSAKHSRFNDDDEHDEDMDDFIEYDDDEEDDYGGRGGGGGGGGGRRGGYDSDASSDMEAGMDDIDVEERRAEMLARKEDVEQERLEMSLKAAKEDRRRMALEAIRAGKKR